RLDRFIRLVSVTSALLQNSHLNVSRRGGSEPDQWTESDSRRTAGSSILTHQPFPEPRWAEVSCPSSPSKRYTSSCTPRWTAKTSCAPSTPSPCRPHHHPAALQSAPGTCPHQQHRSSLRPVDLGAGSLNLR